MAPRRTRRQEITALLEEAAYDFEELRQQLGVPVRLLEEDLRHIERSLRSGPTRLRSNPPCCKGCGFTFRERAPRRFAPPGRCPRCRESRIEGPRLRVV
jgi:predicted Zn-ribbon and HTH transcriptional regulator